MAERLLLTSPCGELSPSAAEPTLPGADPNPADAAFSSFAIGHATSLSRHCARLRQELAEAAVATPLPGRGAVGR